MQHFLLLNFIAYQCQIKSLINNFMLNCSKKFTSSTNLQAILMYTVSELVCTVLPILNNHTSKDVLELLMFQHL